MKWTLIGNRDEWLGYRNRAEQELDTVTVLGWSSNPDRFPVLAAHHVHTLGVEVGRDAVVRTQTVMILVALVYVEDARILLDAARIDASQGQDEMMTAQAEVAAEPVQGPTQQDFNLSVAAHILALSDTLIGIKGTTRERYERDYMARLSLADQLDAARRAELIQQRIIACKPGLGPE